MKVEVEESLLGPEDSEADFRRILEEARNKKGRAIFETFSSEGPTEFLVVSRARWDEHQRKLGTQKEESRIMTEEVEELEENQGETGYEGSPVKAPPDAGRSERRPPCCSKIRSLRRNERQWQADLEEQSSIWSRQERKVIAAMEDYLESVSI